MVKRCLIIAGGEWNQEFASCYMNRKYEGKKPELVIAADSGLHGLHRMGICPDILLGDYDSVSTEVLTQYEADERIIRMQYPEEKDYTDSHLAIMTAIEQGAAEICILGAVGTRMDHTLANVGLLKLCLEAGVKAELVDTHNRIRMMDQQLFLQRQEQFGRYVSLLPFTERVTGITLQGFRYPLREADMELGISRGVSNEITEERAEIRIRTGLLLVIESKD